ncbi:MAG: hypothetical protein GY756_21105, partial [bacterium]|nr:hypothetical protein [bacterium]
MGLVKEESLMSALGKYYEVPTIDLKKFQIHSSVIELLNREKCEKYTAIPISKVGNNLVVAFADPGNIYIHDDLSFITRHKIQTVVAPESSIIAAIEKYYHKSKFEDPFSSMSSKDEKEFINIESANSKASLISSSDKSD